MWGLITATFPIWFYLRLAQHGLLLVGCFCVLLAGAILLRRWLKGTPAKSATPARQSQEWKGTLISRRSPTVTERALRVLVFVVGLVIGWGGHAIQQFNHTVNYRVHVFQRVEPYGYLVSIDGAPKSFLYVCQNIGDPELEAGETDHMIAGYDGKCFDLSGDFGYTTERDSQGQIIHTGVGQ